LTPSLFDRLLHANHGDDSLIQPTAEQLVTSPQAHSTPYILFYRRGDTMVGVAMTV
jgi:hypothetical protein